MPAQRYTDTNLKLVGRHVPEPENTFDASAHDTDDPVTGIYQVGFELDGVFIPIFSDKASKVFSIVERRQSASPVEPEPSGEPPAVVA